MPGSFRVLRDLEGRILGRGAHGELIKVQTAEGNGTGGTQFDDGGGIVRRVVSSFEEFGGTGTGVIPDVDVIFDSDGKATEGEGKICLFGFGESGLRIV